MTPQVPGFWDGIPRAAAEQARSAATSDGWGNASPACPVLIVLVDAAALRTTQKAKPFRLYPQNRRPRPLIQLIWTSVTDTASILYQTYRGSIHPRRRCPACFGRSTPFHPPNRTTLTVTPSRVQTDSVLGRKVTSSIILATAQLLISPTSLYHPALTGRCSLTPRPHRQAARVESVSMGGSTSQHWLEHSTRSIPTNWRAQTGPKQLGHNNQDKHLLCGKVKISGRCPERQNSAGANPPCRCFTWATQMSAKLQSILDTASLPIRDTPAPTLWSMCRMAPAAGTRLPHRPATPVPAPPTSRPPLRATRAGDTSQGTTLDPRPLCPLIPPPLWEADCLSLAPCLKTTLPLSNTKVNGKSSGSGL